MPDNSRIRRNFIAIPLLPLLRATTLAIWRR
jgi:hypothetical protein